MLGYALVDTAFGPIGLAWSPRGIVRVQLPEASREATLDSLRARLDLPPEPATNPPDFVSEAARRLARHLEGALQDLSGVPLDLDTAPDFHRRVYEAARRIPAGRTATYGELAALAGAAPGAARAVGQAMARNPVPIIVPCHRVLAAGGKTGGFSAPGGTDTKARLLALEGVLLL